MSHPPTSTRQTSFGAHMGPSVDSYQTFSNGTAGRRELYNPSFSTRTLIEVKMDFHL